jgi:hypothetical protein
VNLYCELPSSDMEIDLAGIPQTQQSAAGCRWSDSCDPIDRVQRVVARGALEFCMYRVVKMLSLIAYRCDAGTEMMAVLCDGD